MAFNSLKLLAFRSMELIFMLTYSLGSISVQNSRAQVVNNLLIKNQNTRRNHKPNNGQGSFKEDKMDGISSIANKISNFKRFYAESIYTDSHSKVCDVVNVGLLEYCEPIPAHSELMLNLTSLYAYRIELESRNLTSQIELPFQVVHESSPQGFWLTTSELKGLSIELEYSKLQFRSHYGIPLYNQSYSTVLQFKVQKPYKKEFPIGIRNISTQKNRQKLIFNMQPGGNVDDKTIRQQIKKKDFEHVARMKKQMQMQEEELKQYFQKASLPSKEDPSMRKKQEVYNSKISLFKEAFNSFQIFHFWSGFWKYKASTPEQIETLNLCKRKIKRNLAVSSLVGLAVTSLTSYQYRIYFGYPMILFGVSVGIIGGGMFGLISSTKYVLEKLEQLGPQFALGRLIHQQIEDNRLDKKRIS